MKYQGSFIKLDYSMNRYRYKEWNLCFYVTESKTYFKKCTKPKKSVIINENSFLQCCRLVNINYKIYSNICGSKTFNFERFIGSLYKKIDWQVPRKGLCSDLQHEMVLLAAELLNALIELSKIFPHDTQKLHVTNWWSLNYHMGGYHNKPIKLIIESL